MSVDALSMEKSMGDSLSPKQRASISLSELGRKKYLNGRLEMAVFDFQKSLSLDPNNFFSMYYLAEIQLRKYQTKEAFLWLHKAQPLLPSNKSWLAEFYRALGDAYEQVENYQQARIQYARARTFIAHHPEIDRKLEMLMEK